jgi:hypothetical protein
MRQEGGRRGGAGLRVGAEAIALAVAEKARRLVVAKEAPGGLQARKAPPSRGWGPERTYARSKRPAAPIPPPMHIVTTA